MVFTGIIQETAEVINLEKFSDFSQIEISTSLDFIHGIKVGASVSVDGVCLTVTSVKGRSLTFDIIVETLNVTTLSKLKVSELVNLERAARLGDEIGGHIISGHISGVVEISEIKKTDNNHIIFFKIDGKLIKYIFSKGYIALNGISLTIGEVNRLDNTFSIFLIPETLRVTTMGDKKIGDMINLEIETQTKNMVDLINIVRESS